MRALELKGKKFGRLLVISRTENNKYGQAKWECMCDCGNTTRVISSQLNTGHTKSCGCLEKETLASLIQKRIKHGMTRGRYKGARTPTEYTMLIAARTRAKRTGLPCTLELSDIVIPEFCPVFPTIKLNRDNSVQSFDSPSLDRLIPELGYVKGNVTVMSAKANTIKQNATPEEIMAVAVWFKKELEHAR